MIGSGHFFVMNYHPSLYIGVLVCSNSGARALPWASSHVQEALTRRGCAVDRSGWGRFGSSLRS